MYNLVTLSNGKSKFDGFPLFRVLIEIVKKSKELIDLKFKQSFCGAQRIARRNQKKFQNIFKLVCEEYHSGNVFDALKSFIYHFICVFLTIWKYNINTLKSEMNIIFQFFIERDHGVALEPNKIIYLYKKFYCSKILLGSKNKHSIMMYTDVFKTAYNFVGANFGKLSYIEAQSHTLQELLHHWYMTCERKKQFYVK